MNIEIEDATILLNEQRLAYLKRKRKRKHTNRSCDQDFELISLQTYSFPLSASSNIAERVISSQLINNNNNNNNSTDECERVISPRTINDFSTVECESVGAHVDEEEDHQLTDGIDLENNSDDYASSGYSNDTNRKEDLFTCSQALHPYTEVATHSFCYQILYLFRESRLAKMSRHRFLELIQSVLPIPNSLPPNMAKLLALLEIKKNIFRKSKICLLCHQRILTDQRYCMCSLTTDETHIGVIYESDIKFILSTLLKRLWNEIVAYRNLIREEKDLSGTNDIGFAQAYQHLLQQHPNEAFVTALIHLDGISICKSSKLKLWLLSFSLIELPAKIRYQRFNMPVISFWISYKEPVASLWLQSGVDALEELKVSGIVVNDEIVKLKVLAVTGDLPALKIALNFVAHNGYYCCYFCFIRGIHKERKRQYPYDSSCEIRTASSFARNATLASDSKQNQKGHLGVSVFSGLVDIPMPSSIIIDYSHASLLRHSKCIFSELYHRLRPAIRNEIDLILCQQRFPHFFHRRMKSFNDLSFIKATEIRNILFYGFLPIFHMQLPLDVWSHFALFITGIRLLHTRPIFSSETSEIADKLLIKYYQDFSLFYHGLENIVLHLHLHYRDQYKRFGALAHLGLFGQESLMGYMGTNHTGTRYQGDLICENYSLDFILHSEIEAFNRPAKIIDGPFDEDRQFDFTSDDSFRVLHSTKCGCSSIDSCLNAFRRCIIKRQIYHSLYYKRRRKSVSYFVRYCITNDSNVYSFGKIIVFLKCCEFTYAVIEKYPTQSLFSDLLASSSYYQILNEPINHLFYVISKRCLASHECIPVSQIIEHCILFDCKDYYVATPVSSYDEHD